MPMLFFGEKGNGNRDGWHSHRKNAQNSNGWMERRMVENRIVLGLFGKIHKRERERTQLFPISNSVAIIFKRRIELARRIDNIDSVWLAR